ncbi:head GIN domain-containing protein [Ascidiimonas aurantiaca]|uniref:head GIN domain-containing protein n=1 Tax=Ascidiimonas aurantiaca TaxID=1685432 RepID=UPI0030EDAAA2
MRFFGTLVVWVVSLPLLFAQEGTLEQELGTFDQIKVFDGISVELIKASENKIIVSGEDVDKVAVVNNNGTLKIRMEIDKIFNGFETFAKVYYSGRIDLIDVNENAYISLSEPLKQIAVELRAQEGGEIDVVLDVQRLEVKAVTGGTIEASGKAINQNVSVNTGGNYEGDDMKTEQTKVVVNAGGNAYVNASEYVEASVRAGGRIRIYGDPKVIDKKKFLGGRIIEQ